ncbi:MAG: cytochrome c oxidase subunit II [Rhizobacter sp.]
MNPASVEADVLAEVAWVLVIGGFAVLAATMGILALALRRGRRPVPPRWWIVGGAVVPAALLAALAVYSQVRTAGLDAPPPPGALVISVTGRSWWWHVQYRDPRDGRAVVSANELRIPAGRPVHLALMSDDVIHSFWVPALGGKMDLVPGRINRLVVTPHTPGTYRGACAEFCGEQHAKMALHVVVLPPAEFDRWLAAQAAPAGPPRGEVVQRGRELFVERGCAQCHGVRGHTDGADAGPDLTHVASRLHLGAGTVPNGGRALADWLVRVQQLKPGARMPSFHHLPPDDLAALAAYLEALE